MLSFDKKGYEDCWRDRKLYKLANPKKEQRERQYEWYVDPYLTANLSQHQGV